MVVVVVVVGRGGMGGGKGGGGGRRVYQGLFGESKRPSPFFQGSWTALPLLGDSWPVFQGC